MGRIAQELKRIAFVFLFLLHSAFAQQQWSIGYYTPYGSPGSPVSALDMGGLTHIVHWAALVQANGTLDLNYQQIAADGPGLITKAHGAGVKVILGLVNPYWIGQSGNLPSAAANYRAALVSNVMNVVNTYGYDGVDIDWEPLNVSTDGANFKALAADLKAQLGAKPLMTATIVTDYAFWGSAHSSFDRINMMTYDMCGTWDSYSWYNSALYDQDGMVWSVNLAATRYKNAGVPAYKLGIGIPFYGYQWSGVSGPRQTMSGASMSQINYQSLASMIGNPQWDSLAKVPYTTGSNSWISLDNAQSITEKVNYVKANGLGGWIIWNLSSDYIPTANPQHPLLTAVKNAMGPASTTAPSITSTSPLAEGLVGTAYSQSLAATGTAPISWSITSGALPAGLNLGTGNGVISGIPTAAGASSFTVKATDASGANGTKVLSINISAPLTITTAALPDGTANVGYGPVVVAASGGTSPYTWALTGTLPAGLILAPSTGVISGTPTSGGSSSFSVRVGDANSGSVSRAFSINVASSAAKATMLTPAPGGALPGPSVTFTWTAGTGVAQYALYFGSTAGGADLGSTYASGTSYTAMLPATGGTIYVRLWSQIGGVWQANDYTYTGANAAKAVMTSPATGSTLPGPSATFTWTPGAGVTQYALYFGSTAGGADLGSTYVSGTSYTASLPVNGIAIYVRLWSQIGGIWQANDYTYTAANIPKAVMSSPAPGSTLPGALVTFAWTPGTGVTQYALYFGSTPGAANLGSTYAAGTSFTAALPATGGALYVRLWSQIGGVWQANDYTYTAASGTKAVMTSPASGSTVPGATMTFNWTTGTGVTQYALYFGSTPGAADLGSTYAAGTSFTAALPARGAALYVRLWSQIGGIWQANDYSYTH
jgi:hypothetical protein